MNSELDTNTQVNPRGPEYPTRREWQRIVTVKVEELDGTVRHKTISLDISTPEGLREWEELAGKHRTVFPKKLARKVIDADKFNHESLAHTLKSGADTYWAHVMGEGGVYTVRKLPLTY